MKAPPDVVYAQLKFKWASGARDDSLNFLRQFSDNLARDLQSESRKRTGVSKHKLHGISGLLARCYFKQGEWQVELKDDWGSVSNIAFTIAMLMLIVITEKCERYIAFLFPCYTL